jgi:class 3 adenylate cyclase/CHASE2 domain-containing sensor protein
MRFTLNQKKRYSWFALFAIVGCALAQVLLASGLLGFADRPLHDLWFQWQGKRLDSRHVVVVSLDEETLSAYPDDPLVFWTDKLAVAVARLRQAQVRVVGLDILMGISPERWLAKQGEVFQQAAREYDQPFRDQLNSGKLVLVASKPGSSRSANDFLLPSPDYLLALPDFDMPRYIGIADFAIDPDGIVRQFQMTALAPAPTSQAGQEDGLPVMGFPALVTIHAAGLEPKAASWRLGGQDVPHNPTLQAIRFIGPSETVKTISLKDVLAGDGLSSPLAAQLRDKIVLIGAGAGLGDDHLTPYSTSFLSSRGRMMTGVEIHANVIESLVSGERLTHLSPYAVWVVSGLLSAASVVVFASVSAWVGALLWACVAVALVGLGFVAFAAGVLMPVAAFALSSAVVLMGVIGWRLSGEERERARLRQMFGRYVSNQVVEELLQSGERPELGGKMQMVTVLFSDIRNFTTMSELLNPKEVVEMLNTYFEQACAVVLKEGGSIDKFIGDAIMVEFGSPMPVPDHAVRAVSAALALRDVAHEFGNWMDARFPGRNLPKFAVGIGLHSGDALIGNIGSSSRMEFTAIGDTVNLASRVEGKTKELGCTILATQATKTAAGDALVTGRCECIQVKGRTAAVNVYEVIGFKTEVNNV